MGGTSAEDVLQYLDNGPQCVVTICPDSGSILRANNTFVKQMGPLFKFQNCSFSELATEKDGGKEILQQAIEYMREANTSEDEEVLRKRLRNIEMISLADNIPMKYHFDWLVLY